MDHFFQVLKRIDAISERTQRYRDEAIQRNAELTSHIAMIRQTINAMEQTVAYLRGDLTRVETVLNTHNGNLEKLTGEMSVVRQLLVPPTSSGPVVIHNTGPSTHVNTQTGDGAVNQQAQHLNGTDHAR